MDFREKVINTFKNKEFLKWKTKAESYVDDKEKTKELIEVAMEKAENKKLGPIEEVWDKLQLLFSLVKDWVNGSYKEISKGTIITSIIGIVYFVSPVDIMPDFIAGLGFIDDAAIIGFVIKQISGDLERYKLWKDDKIINRE